MVEVPEKAKGGTRRAPRLVTPPVLDQWPLPEPSGPIQRGQPSSWAERVRPPAGLRAGSPRCARVPDVSASRWRRGASTSRRVAECVRPVRRTEVGRCRWGSGAALAKGSTADACSSDRARRRRGHSRLLTEVVRELPWAPRYPRRLRRHRLPTSPPTRSRALRGDSSSRPTRERGFLLGQDEVDDEDVLDGALEVSRASMRRGCDSWVVSDRRIWQITTRHRLGTSGSGEGGAWRPRPARRAPPGAGLSGASTSTPPRATISS